MKKKITDTRDNLHVGWLFGGNPRAIEAQEAQGQSELADSNQLPSKVNSPRGLDAKAEYEKRGIKVFGESGNDELFLTVQLPLGWKVEPTEHSMWSYLIDSNGKKVASIFYKAAFYDRDAFINFEE